VHIELQTQSHDLLSEIEIPYVDHIISGATLSTTTTKYHYKICRTNAPDPPIPPSQMAIAVVIRQSNRWSAPTFTLRGLPKDTGTPCQVDLQQQVLIKLIKRQSKFHCQISSTEILYITDIV
jgi:hypothetical protein